MNPALKIIMWLALAYFALQALWIIIQLILCGGASFCMLLLWLRRHPAILFCMAVIAIAGIIFFLI